jgi:hypothetical protein
MAINNQPSQDDSPRVERRTGRRQRRGSLTIEWIALVTILVIGVIGGLGVVRNALIREFHDLTEAICETDVLDEQLGPQVDPP